MVRRSAFYLAALLATPGLAAFASGCSSSSGGEPVDGSAPDSAHADAGGDAAFDAGAAADADSGLDVATPSEAAPPGDAGSDVAIPGDAGPDVTAPPDAGDATVPGDASVVDGTVGDGALPDDADAANADAADGSPDAGTLHSISALSFDGVADWVHLPAAPGGASTTAFSVELWFRTTTDVGNMFEVYDSGGGADRFLSLNSGTVCFYVYDDAGVQVCTTAATYADGAWHHACGTLGASGMNLYVDGAPAAALATTTVSSFSAGSDFRLGMGHTAFDSAIVYFQGDLDEVRVWSVERSAADVAASYRQTVDPATSGLQGYWKLDESGTASTTADATSEGNDGTLMSFTFSPSPWVQPGAF